MAKRKRRLTRDQSIFVLLAILAVLISLFIGLIVGFAGGKFDSKLFLILFFSFLVVFAAALIVFSHPKVKGRMGEARVNKALKKLSKEYGGHFIHNVIVAGADGKTSQIDHVYVCTRGVFIIETKNYAGRIYGSDGQKQWTQVLAYGHTKNKLYSPVYQNWTHIHRLQEALGEEIDMVNVVIFVRGNIEFIESVYVYDIRGFKHMLHDREPFYPESKVESIASSIQSYKENPAQTSKEHVEEIRATKTKISEGTCPRCGGQLVLRTAKKTGKRFFGCSNYPNCKFTKEIE